MIPEVPISTLRLTLRISNAFVVETVTVCSRRRDFTDALILMTLGQCSASPFVGNFALQRRYGAFETPPPSELRRPISINAVAASLGLPFETARRRAKRLLADGICEVVPEGLQLRQELLTCEEQDLMFRQIYDLVRSLYHRIKLAGCLDLMGLPLQSGQPWTDVSPPVRIVGRSAVDYVLRLMEHLLPNFQSLSRAFIVLAVVRANTEGMPDVLRGADGAEAEAFPSDDLRRPAKAGDVATILGLPHETVRRHIAALIEDGRCERVRDGVIVPGRVLARQSVISAWGANFRNLSRMFAELSETGVLALWDGEAAADQSAA